MKVNESFGKFTHGNDLMMRLNHVNNESHKSKQIACKEKKKKQSAVKLR